MNLNDTGLVRVDGIWQRAATVRETPLQFSVEWTRAQLGQITKFFTGNDKGWRGEVQFDATVTGTPASVKISSTISADDFRRYDITSGRAMRLAARCDAIYEAPTHQLKDILCNGPVGAGLVKITGTAGLPGSHAAAAHCEEEAAGSHKISVEALEQRQQSRGKNNIDDPARTNRLLKSDRRHEPLASKASPGRNKCNGRDNRSVEKQADHYSH